ncbi:CMRF35-like molecule 6 isoform X2 [Cervus canadensis]|uniref:CMRF35-like molecule 6 isoform X2 n=1 Tax=Cervus canadensis TaxID=1574408 RepID=UPI001C9E2B26|nr:CMRF35-like molecule 6 isoform X2 [Cervus canadensis]
MTPRGRAGWLPSALLLLQVPGCLSLSGPRRLTGIVGGSLNVECRYQEEFINNSKYWCKFPFTMTTTSPERSTSTPESPTTLPVPTWSTVSGPEAPDPGQAHRSLLGSVHFLLLVFLKVPLLLGMLGAVLWVHRPLRSSADRDRQSRSIYENQ